MAERKFTNYGAVSARDYMEVEDAGSMKSLSSVISRSTLPGEQAFESAFSGFRTPIFEGSSKYRKDTQSSDITDSTLAISVKSDFSTETGLPLTSKSYEIIATETPGNDLNSFGDSFFTWTHESLHRTESSCSNSLPFILPVSLPKHGYQKTSEGAYSFRNYSGSLSSSNSKGFDHRTEEPMTASPESGEIEAMKSKTIEMDPEVMEKVGNDLKVNVSFECSMTKPGNVSLRYEGPFVTGFDLNKDISIIGMDDFIEPAVETVSSHSVIHVVAKAGIPRCLPVTPLEFKGELGWKGSSDKSAFRPAVLPKKLDAESCLRNYSLKEQLGFTGIDLNFAAIENSSAVELEYEDGPSVFTSQNFPLEVVSRRADGLSIDLNSLHDLADEFPQPSPPAKSEALSLMDLNLNANALVGNNTCNNDHWLYQGHRSLESKISYSTNQGKQDFNVTSNPCLTDLSLTQVLNHAHAPQYLVAVPNIIQPHDLMQRVAPLQPRLPYLSHTLLPNSYPSKAPYCPGTIPYVRDPYEHSVSSCIQSPYSIQVTSNGQSNSSVIYPPTPMIDVKAVDKLSTSQSQMEEAREHIFLAKNTPIDEHIKSSHREAWFSTSMKRKEPEGGLDYYHLGFRQVI